MNSNNNDLNNNINIEDESQVVQPTVNYQQNGLVINNNLSSEVSRSKKNIVIIIICVVVAILFLIITIKMITNYVTGNEISKKTVDKTTRRIDNSKKEKKVNVKSTIFNITIFVGDVQRGVTYTENSDLKYSELSLNGTYTKVKVTFKNDGLQSVVNGIVIPMKLLDSSKNEIATCNYGTGIKDDRFENEKLPGFMPAKSTISGYVYCKTDSNSASFLKIRVVARRSMDANGKLEDHNKDYYVKLD